MGKRKQECPRKLFEDSKGDLSELSKLENVVKKLKSSVSEPVSGSVAREATVNEAAGAVKQSANQPEALDLRIPRFSDSNKLSMVSCDKRQNENVSVPADGDVDRALDLSSCNSHNYQPLSTSASPKATTFQELSARLEEYFSTGIAASKFPKRMVRGQDIWIQDIEQKRAILKCLKCGASYNSLSELAKHIKKSGHHEDFSIPENSRFRPSLVPLPPSKKAGLAEKSSHVEYRNAPVEKSERRLIPSASPEFVRGPSAFRPIKCNQIIRDFQPKQLAASPKAAFYYDGVKLQDSLTTGSISHNQRTEFLETANTSASSYIPFAENKDEKIVSFAEPPRAAIEQSSSLKCHAVNCSEMSIPHSILPASTDVSPLFALKRFLEFGIPILRPAGVDGGRI